MCDHSGSGTRCSLAASETMKDSIRNFIERMGLEAERDGMPRIGGRVLGYLVTSDEPSSLDTIAEALQVSRASISTNCRMLEQLGAADRMSLPGDRKDYYVLSPRFPDRFFDHVRTQSERKVAIAEKALHELPDDEQIARERMETWRQFHAFILEELEGIARRWHARSSEPDASPEPDGSDGSETDHPLDTES